MTTSDDNDVRLSLAVLTAKFEAAQAQNTHTLEAIKTLLMQEQAQIRAQMEHNRSNADMRFQSIEREFATLKEGVEEGKLDRARASGRAGVISVVVSAAIGILSALVSVAAKHLIG